MSAAKRQWQRVRVTLERLRDDRSGAITVIFAITLIPILGVIALSLDYGRASDAELTITRAADSAILSAQRISPAPKAKLKQAFESTFRANLPKKYESATSEVSFKGDMSRMSAVATYTMPTAFMVIIGKPTFTVAVQTAARLRVVPTGIPTARGGRSAPSRTQQSAPRSAEAEQIRRLLREKIEEARRQTSSNPAVQRMLDQMSQKLGR